jgi:hypothetical protein
LEYLGLDKKPKAEVHPEHKLTGQEEEQEQEQEKEEEEKEGREKGGEEEE